MIAAAIIAALACAALAYVAAPLRKGRRPTNERAADIEELESRKRAALTAILDIENEREVGKLSTEDFEVLRAEYEVEAVTALVELDALRVPDEDRLEAEIAAIRDRLGRETSRAEPEDAVIACPSCGAPRVMGRACERCGA